MSFIHRLALPDGLNDIAKFGSVIHRLQAYRLNFNDQVYIDLKNVPFISPYGLTGLLLLGKHIYKITNNRSYVIDSKEEVIKYLERMDLFEIGSSWFHHPEIKNKHSRNEKTKKLLEIQKISTSKEQGKLDVDEITEKFRKRASLILDSFQDRMDVNYFVKVIGELCTNVYTHSQSDGYIAIQRYNYPQREFEVVKLSVMDDGIGIKSSLNAMYNFNYQNETDYLIKALEPNVSGAGDRGFGLYAVKSIIEKSAGYLWINSDESAILIEPGEIKAKEYINLPFMKGTRIAIILSFGKIDFSLDKDGQDNLLSF